MTDRNAVVRNGACDVRGVAGCYAILGFVALGLSAGILAAAFQLGRALGELLP